MPTVNQLCSGVSKWKMKKNPVLSLGGAPFSSGECTKVFVMNPKKPNSAMSKVANVSLTNGLYVSAGMPGLGHDLQQYSEVLVWGGWCNDLPGVRYKLVWGKYDFIGNEWMKSSNSSSKFGSKKEKH